MDCILDARACNATEGTLPISPTGLAGWLGDMRDALSDQGFSMGRPAQRNIGDALIGYRSQVYREGRAIRLDCDLVDGANLAMRMTFTDAATGELVLGYRLRLGSAADAGEMTWLELEPRLLAHRFRLSLMASYLSQSVTNQSH